MDNTLSEFVARFEKEHLDTFALVKHSIADLEGVCLQRNQRCRSGTSIEELIRLEKRTKSQSSSSLSGCLVLTTRPTRENSNLMDLGLEELQVETETTSPLGAKADIDNFLETPASSTDSGNLQMEPIKTKSMSVYMEGEYTPSKNIKISPLHENFQSRNTGGESSESPSMKPLGEKVPFFALNIKTLKLPGIHWSLIRAI